MHRVLLAGLAWLAAQTESPAPGQLSVTPAADPPLEGAPADTPVRPGGYAGVAPGQDVKNPLAPPRSDPPRLVWTGFKMAGEQSEIFLQTTRPVTYELAEPSGTRGGNLRLSVFLRNCRIHLRNNGRRLDTRFFATAVEEVSARQRRRDVEIVVALEGPATPTVRTEPGPDGTHFLVLTFPPGRAVQPAATAPLDERAIEPPAVSAPAYR